MLAWDDQGVDRSVEANLAFERGSCRRGLPSLPFCWWPACTLRDRLRPRISIFAQALTLALAHVFLEFEHGGTRVLKLARPDCVFRMLQKHF